LLEGTTIEILDELVVFANQFSLWIAGVEITNVPETLKVPNRNRQTFHTILIDILKEHPCAGMWELLLGCVGGVISTTQDSMHMSKV
jgi:hypothetical protein